MGRGRPGSPPPEFSGGGFLDSSGDPVLPAGADRLSAPVADVVVDEPLGGLQNGVEGGLPLVGGRRGDPRPTFLCKPPAGGQRFTPMGEIDGAASAKYDT